MPKNLFLRSKRFAFVKSTLNKYRSQLKLLERNRRQPNEDQYIVLNKECENQEGLESVSKILTDQHIYYWKKSLDDNKDEIGKEEKEEEEEDIFYDCKENSSNEVFHTDTEEDNTDHTASKASNHLENSPSNNLHEGTEVIDGEATSDEDICSDDEGEETMSRRLADRKVELFEENDMRGAGPERVNKKGKWLFGQTSCAWTCLYGDWIIYHSDSTYVSWWRHGVRCRFQRQITMEEFASSYFLVSSCMGL